MRRKQIIKRNLPLAGLVLVIAAAFLITGKGRLIIPPASDLSSEEHKADYRNIVVVRVIDGDTVELENGERVRLIGIDTPESRMNEKLKRDSLYSAESYDVIIAMGKKSARFTKQLLAKQRVRLEFDAQKRDKYGRLLAYVYVKRLCAQKGAFIRNIVHGDVLPQEHRDHEVELFVNAEIVKQGYADLMTIPPNVKYAELFQKLYQQARQENRGLWK
ncbi:MAG: thermonuclease family protein [Candidatus Omnitrophica bacterium]|nr:thermonuclease family protein [Candidatus Omnitrophota bacterium]MBU4478602.1 thermonuclease family protein [Candidatus Omnitrophota bacterium]